MHEDTPKFGAGQGKNTAPAKQTPFRPNGDILLFQEIYRPITDELTGLVERKYAYVKKLVGTLEGDVFALPDNEAANLYRRLEGAQSELKILFALQNAFQEQTIFIIDSLAAINDDWQRKHAAISADRDEWQRKYTALAALYHSTQAEARFALDTAVNLAARLCDTRTPNDQKRAA